MLEDRTDRLSPNVGKEFTTIRCVIFQKRAHFTKTASPSEKGIVIFQYVRNNSPNVRTVLPRSLLLLNYEPTQIGPLNRAGFGT
jgi:aminoglycoside N3'-acetyltransferase